MALGQPSSPPSQFCCLTSYPLIDVLRAHGNAWGKHSFPTQSTFPNHGNFNCKEPLAQRDTDFMVVNGSMLLFDPFMDCYAFDLIGIVSP